MGGSMNFRILNGDIDFSSKFVKLNEIRERFLQEAFKSVDTFKNECINRFNDLDQLKKDGETFGYNYLNNYIKIAVNIIKEFDELPLKDIKKPRVGIVGEILVKFLPLANNFLVDLLESEGAEAVCPDLLDFFMYSLYNANFKAEYLGKKKSGARINNLLIAYLENYRKVAKVALQNSRRFEPPTPIAHMAEYASPIVSCGNQTGEGWFLTGEMIELIKSGVSNIVCAQPFGCLPNHVVGKGVIKELRRQYEHTNIVAVDYDPGASEVNQLNRIKLMLATAEKNLV